MKRVKIMKLNGSEIILNVLLDHGVDTVFGYPGGAALNIYDALYHYRDRIRHIMSAHEQGAAHAADGYARATGRVGVVFSTSGPGATNLVTGIATAYMDSTPMVAITANVAEYLIGKASFQEIDIVKVTRAITKKNYFINKIEDLEPALREGFRIANSGRKGPVLIDVTKDVTGMEYEFCSKLPYPLDELPAIDEPTLMEIVEEINKAKQPMAYVGGGCVASDSGKEIRDLIYRADMPMVHTLMAAGIVSCNDEKNLGLVGMHGFVAANKAIYHSDLVIALGARFSDRVALNPKKWAPNAKIIQIDIDKNEINKNVNVAKYCVSDIKDFIRRALPHIKQADHRSWSEQVSMWKHEVSKFNTKVDPQSILEKLSSMVDEDTIFVTDVGQHQMWSAQYLAHRKPKKFLTSGGLGTMGFGYGAAIGAKLGCKDNRVIHITGDGSFHMNLNEACTAVSQNLPIITIIFNNSVLGMVYQWQTDFYQGHYSSTCPERKTDFLKLAEAFGLKAFRATEMDELEDALEQALKMDGPVWIECVIDRNQKVLPMIPSGKSVKDIIVE